MTGSTNDYDDHSSRQRLAAATQYSEEPIDLESIVVRYENRSDRCTITPRECPEAETDDDDLAISGHHGRRRPRRRTVNFDWPDSRSPPNYILLYMITVID